MAFVFREERKTDLHKSPTDLGPGTYQLHIQKENKLPKTTVPFGTLQPRIKNIEFQKLKVPGPGTYNLQQNQPGEKIILSYDKEEIKIMQIVKPNPVFRSGTQRFKLINGEKGTPGPGEYILKQNILQRQKMLSTSTNTSQKPKILENIININKYQSIPSIPSNIHAYGYNENQNNELQLNQPPIQIYRGEKEDIVGPGYYNIEETSKVKGVSCWSQAREKRLEVIKSSLNIGPGSYELKNSHPLYSYKPSAGFVSKSLRSSLDQRNHLNSRQNNPNCQKLEENQRGKNNPVQSRAISDKNPPSTTIDEEEDEYEYVEDSTPGPGCYFKKTSEKSIKAGKAGFGVGTKRFPGFNNSESNAYVGPGSYQIKKDFKKKKQKKIVIANEVSRFPELINKNKLLEPGPGAYDPRVSLQEKLISKIQRGYRGQFGSSQVRVKEEKDEGQPGPGQYNPKEIVDQKDSLSVFKSRGRRRQMKTENNGPPPGTYETNLYDIATKIKKEEEENPDLMIKKPAFGIGEVRFKEPPKKDENIDDDIIKQIQEKYKEEKKKKCLINSSSFKNRQTRFKDTDQELPGPGAYYDGEEDHWNKKTYNILFADI